MSQNFFCQIDIILSRRNSRWQVLPGKELLWEFDYQNRKRQRDLHSGQKNMMCTPNADGGRRVFSDTDVIRYGKVSSLDDIVWDKKSDYSFKETLLPINETLFIIRKIRLPYPKGPQKGLLIFLRSCDPSCRKTFG